MKSLQRFTQFGVICGLAAVLLAIGGGVIAQQTESTPEATVVSSEGESALLRMLAHVPDVPSNRYILLFNDRLAMEAAYPPAQMPANYSEFTEMRQAAEQNATASAQNLWWQIWFNSGPSRLVQNLTPTIDSPAIVGFDFFQIERELVYGFPSLDGKILEGNFDVEAVRTALEARDYETIEQHGLRELLCPIEGCNDGIRMNLRDANSANPFGGEFGRRQPIAISEDTIVSSTVLDNVSLAMQNDRPTLADSISYQAAVNAAINEGLLLQAYFWDVNALPTLGDVEGFQLQLQLSTDGDWRTQLQRQLETFEELPAPHLLMFADVVSDTEQIGLVALVYDSNSEAQSAAAVIPSRVEHYISVSPARPIIEQLAERNVEGIEAQVVEYNGRAVTLIRFATPKATPDQIREAVPSVINTADITPPGSVFRFIVDLAERHEVGWLTTITRAELEALMED